MDLHTRWKTLVRRITSTSLHSRSLAKRQAHFQNFRMISAKSNSRRSRDYIADLMNNRPRQKLDWRSPYQDFQQLMLAIKQHQDAPIH